MVHLRPIVMKALYKNYLLFPLLVTFHYCGCEHVTCDGNVCDRSEHSVATHSVNFKKTHFLVPLM